MVFCDYNDTFVFRAWNEKYCTSFTLTACSSRISFYIVHRSIVLSNRMVFKKEWRRRMIMYSFLKTLYNFNSVNVEGRHEVYKRRLFGSLWPIFSLWTCAKETIKRLKIALFLRITATSLTSTLDNCVVNISFTDDKNEKKMRRNIATFDNSFPPRLLCNFATYKANTLETGNYWILYINKYYYLLNLVSFNSQSMCRIVLQPPCISFFF